MNNYNTSTYGSAPTITPRSATPETSKSNIKLSLIIIIVLSIALLLESIVLIVTLSNYFDLTGSNDEESLEESTVLVDPNYTWDEEGNLASMEVTCTADDGSRFVLGKDGKYQEYNSSSTEIDSGTYTISSDSLVSLSSTKTTGEKVLYYTGFELAYNTTIYNCDEETAENGAG